MSKKCKNNMNLNVQPCHCEPVRAWQSIQTPHQPQSGRSMVEMLGVLAIIGVLSVGAIGGYSYAMNKHRTDELIYEATKQVQWAGIQMEMNRGVTPTLTGGTFGGGTIETTVAPGLPATQVGIQITGMSESVCESLSRIVEDNPNGVVRAVQADCNAKTATLIFNQDLSTSDSTIPESDPEVSGEATGTATDAAPATTTGPSDRVIHCNDRGDWDGSSCDCDAGYDGRDCAIELNDSCSGHGIFDGSTCACETGWYGSDCSCSYDEVMCNTHGHWCGSYCRCDAGWGFNLCCTDARSACGTHGTWVETACRCDEGWYGPMCNSQNNRSICGDTGTWIADSGRALYGGYCLCDEGQDCSLSGRKRGCAVSEEPSASSSCRKSS